MAKSTSSRASSSSTSRYSAKSSPSTSTLSTHQVDEGYGDSASRLAATYNKWPVRASVDRRKRLAANARERKRMHLLNNAYDELRCRLADADNKSKYDVLVQAKEYIQALASICEKFDKQNPDHPSVKQYPHYLDQSARGGRVSQRLRNQTMTIKSEDESDFECFGGQPAHHGPDNFDHIGQHSTACDLGPGSHHSSHSTSKSPSLSSVSTTITTTNNQLSPMALELTINKTTTPPTAISPLDDSTSNNLIGNEYVQNNSSYHVHNNHHVIEPIDLYQPQKQLEPSYQLIDNNNHFKHHYTDSKTAQPQVHMQVQQQFVPTDLFFLQTNASKFHKQLTTEPILHMQMNHLKCFQEQFYKYDANLRNIT